MTEKEVDQLAAELMDNRIELMNFINETFWEEDYNDEYLEGLADDLEGSEIEMIHFIERAIEED